MAEDGQVWNEARVGAFRAALLGWYDAQGRALPWRVRNGNRADPYAVWLSEVMLQQTTVAHATPYWERFVAAFPTVCDLAEAPSETVMGMWAGLGYYARARNLHACAKVVCARGGVFPDTEAGLRELPGVGAYTAAAIAAICYGEAANVVDGNVERVVSRLFAVGAVLPKARKTLRALAGTLVRPERAGDYPQALMDLGATVCRPRSPDCPSCPVRPFCAAYAEGDVERYPVKAKRRAVPTRRGVAFVHVDGGRVRLERRPATGLLGGTLGFPGTEWREGGASAEGVSAEDVSAEDAIGVARHAFSHFHLELSVVARAHDDGEWHPVAEIARLPTVMRKVWDVYVRDGESS